MRYDPCNLQRANQSCWNAKQDIVGGGVGDINLRAHVGILWTSTTLTHGIGKIKEFDPEKVRAF